MPDNQVLNFVNGHISKNKQLSNKACFLAPEIISHNLISHKNNQVELTPQVDMWSLGCIVYNMVAGVPPYFQDDLKDLQQEYLYSDARLRMKEDMVFVDNSPEFVDYYKVLLDKGINLMQTLSVGRLNQNPIQDQLYKLLMRGIEFNIFHLYYFITLEQALEHPWIISAPALRSSLPRSVLKDAFKKLKEYRLDCELLKLVGHLIANYLIPKDKKIVAYKVFAAMDIGGKGYISKSDMTQIFQENEFVKEEIGIIFESLDSNKDGKITFTDICPGLIDKKELFSKSNLREAMLYLDPDNDKVISFNDLRLLLDPEAVEDIEIQTLIKQIEGEVNIERGLSSGIQFRNFLIFK